MVLWWLDKAYPDQINKFKGSLKKGRLAISGLTYNGTPLSDAVSLAYLFQGKRTLEERFGMEIKTVNIHDVNLSIQKYTELVCCLAVLLRYYH